MTEFPSLSANLIQSMKNTFHQDYLQDLEELSRTKEVTKTISLNRDMSDSPLRLLQFHRNLEALLKQMDNSEEANKDKFKFSQHILDLKKLGSGTPQSEEKDSVTSRRGGRLTFPAVHLPPEPVSMPASRLQLPPLPPGTFTNVAKTPSSKSVKTLGDDQEKKDSSTQRFLGIGILTCVIVSFLLMAFIAVGQIMIWGHLKLLVLNNAQNISGSDDREANDSEGDGDSIPMTDHDEHSADSVEFGNESFGYPYPPPVKLGLSSSTAIY
ncbi:uncharacterized protein LOC119941619 [Tachyglossus aculeatus]|uniref:uncharacterized protein LOC119941619 n=1 Tax=Tachyglossus aculeatus TaxID=9261 RepID=UPI0018F320A2|nr:uncharacterized protein LOC119941619 [Tachyglossus aculeatus]